MILSKSGGEVRMNSAASGPSDGFPAVSPLSPAALDSFFSIELHFPSMIDGKVEPKTPARPALPKGNYYPLGTIAAIPVMPGKDSSFFT